MMIVKPVQIVARLLFLLACFAPPALTAQAGTSDQIAAISPEAYEKLLSDSVSDEHSVKLEQGTTLRVELAAEEKVLFFTRPGHPAHPGVVEVRIVEAEDGPSLDTAGWWAGDAEAYRDWYLAFKRRNARLSRQWRQDDGPY
jgi:hypothetical protein